MNQNIKELYDKLSAAHYRRRLAGAACFNAKASKEAATIRLAKAEKNYAEESAAVEQLQAEIERINTFSAREEWKGMRRYPTVTLWADGTPHHNDTVFVDWFESDEAAKTGLAEIMAQQGYKVTDVRIGAVTQVMIEPPKRSNAAVQADIDAGVAAASDYAKSLGLSPTIETDSEPKTSKDESKD